MRELPAENLPDGSWSPVLAAEIPTLQNNGISEDLLTVTWRLRPGVTWHDGEPLTSDDVKCTWETASMCFCRFPGCSS
jgi:peptide/nickel transport system substrate-binding protein